MTIFNSSLLMEKTSLLSCFADFFFESDLSIFFKTTWHYVKINYFCRIVYKSTTMDAKVTLSFDKEVIEKAKALAEAHNISLSRFLEYLLRKATSGNYREL